MDADVAGDGALVEYHDGYVETADLEAAVEGRGYDVTCVEPR